jgi:hypothetical protein
LRPGGTFLGWLKDEHHAAWKVAFDARERGRETESNRDVHVVAADVANAWNDGTELDWIGCGRWNSVHVGTIRDERPRPAAAKYADDSMTPD